MFFLDFWKINQNISKIFPLLKIFGNKNGIFRGTQRNSAKRWVFFLSFFNLSMVAPRGWVFSLSFLLEFCPWVLVFSAADVKKKPALNGHNKGPYKRSFWFQHLWFQTCKKKPHLPSIYWGWRLHYELEAGIDAKYHKTMTIMVWHMFL